MENRKKRRKIIHENDSLKREFDWIIDDMINFLFREDVMALDAEKYSSEYRAAYQHFNRIWMHNAKIWNRHKATEILVDPEGFRKEFEPIEKEKSPTLIKTLWEQAKQLIR